MTLDDAVQQPGAKVQAWCVSPMRDGRYAMALYELGLSGAKYLYSGMYPKGEVDALRADLEKRGIPSAGTTEGASYVWFEDERGVSVYTDTALVLAGEDDTLTAGGQSWPRDALAKIIAFADAKRIERGIKAALKNGEEVKVHSETSAAAFSDPAYSRDELLFDAEWVAHVAAAVSKWAGLGNIETRGF